jgi:hypothetical protein
MTKSKAAETSCSPHLSSAADRCGTIIAIIVGNPSRLSKRVIYILACHMHHSSWDDVVRCQMISIQAAPVAQTAGCEERDARILKVADGRPVVVAMADTYISVHLMK